MPETLIDEKEGEGEEKKKRDCPIVAQTDCYKYLMLFSSSTWLLILVQQMSFTTVTPST